MGSKKHKKESKKKKHKSRSRSPLDGEERERKRHKKHKDRKKDRSPDVVEVPVDSHLARAESEEPPAAPAPPAPAAPPAPPPRLERSASKERERRMREQRRHDREKEERRERESPPGATGAGGAGGAGGGGAESLSVEETNRLRAKLGLKPLEVNQAPAEDGKLKDDLGEFYHKPAANIAQQQKTDKIRQKLEERKEKRKLEEKLKTKTLGEESESDDAAAWVRRSRDLQRQKQDAARRAAVLDELDAEFGVAALLEAEQADTRAAAYSAHDLRGLRVVHDLDALGEERETILTLADKPVLGDDDDELVNVNMLDDDKYRQNIVERRKARAGYQAYEDAEDVQAAARGEPRRLLAKYDDELEPARRRRAAGFTIGLEPPPADPDVPFYAVERRLESLQLPAPQPARDYLDHTELVTFKKPKKKGKMRRKAKQEPIDVDDYDAGAAPLFTDDTEVGSGGAGAGGAGGAELAQDPEETEPDAELQAALARARRLRHLEAPAVTVKAEPPAAEEGAGADGMELDGAAGMVLDATAEFCRTLGDIPTYGQAGNRDAAAEPSPPASPEPEPAPGAWARVEPGAPEPAPAPAPHALGAEPRLGAGVAGALQLALSKGYLERPGAAPAPRSQHLHLLQARHYSIEDKAHADDERHGRRERGGGGPLVDFREKGGFRPSIKLEYVDDDGHPLCPKEAFRYLSHKFHGKGPGKNKQEKRIKKQVQEGLMKKMSSTDTPLNTLQMLQDKQRETHSPYIVLSGTKRAGDN